MNQDVKNAALHFRAYLQAEGHLDVNGAIDTQKLIDVFTNEYQPKFHSHLHRGDLLISLSIAKVIRKKKKKTREDKITFVLNNASQDTPLPESRPKVKVFINEDFVFKRPKEKQPCLSGNKCLLCNQDFNSEEDSKNHLNDEIHILRDHYRTAKNKLTNVIDGIEIKFSRIEDESSTTAQNIILRPSEDSEVVTVEVKNTMNTVEYTLDNVFRICDLREVSLRVGDLPQVIRPGIPLRYNLETHFTTPGAFIYPVVFKFCQINNNDRRKSVQYVLREIVFRIQSDLMDALKPTSPYRRPQKKIISVLEGPILGGIPLPQKHKLPPKVVFLKDYNIPKLVVLLLKSKLQPLGENMTKELEMKLQEIKQLLGDGKSYKESLTLKNYAQRFHLLLYLEEFKTDVDIREYDKTDQVLEKRGSMFYLKVEGLSENRPSVMRHDSIYVCKAGDRTVRYEGIVHEVHEDGVLLGFHKDLEKMYLPNMKFDVFFVNNRYTIRMSHRAIELIDKDKAADIIFPQQRLVTASQSATQIALQRFQWVNRKIGNNPEQQQAVRNIVNKTSSPAPYLIFGPPGTGKTVTVVEAICQIWHLDSAKRIKQLVCAPSNAACDVVTERLLKNLPKGAKLFRLYAIAQSFDSIREEFKTAKIVNLLDRDLYIPSVEEIRSFDIIVCTAVTAGRLVTIGVPPNHFSYVFVDECGQSMEPEALIPVARIITANEKIKGQLVLAGDPKQLGPVLRSRLATEMGLGMSLLERLMEHNPLYQKNLITEKYNSQYLTKLVQNYRSHESILHVPNECFYDNELQVKGAENEINKALRWGHLPNKNFPVLFHGIQGKDERESTSPSYFNRQEVDRVSQYVMSLLGEKLSGYKVEEKDIGIITPYRKQVQKFHATGKRFGWKNVKVGSVEEFQGDEKLIIIISTVRSNQNLLEEDYYFNLGFLKNPKRFNVAVTRAKALLIVVGNPFVLRCDPHWYALLKYCQDNKAYIGCKFPVGDPPPPPPNLHSLAMDFAAMSLAGDQSQQHPEGGLSFRREQ